MKWREVALEVLGELGSSGLWLASQGSMAWPLRPRGRGSVSLFIYELPPSRKHDGKLNCVSLSVSGEDLASAELGDWWSRDTTG